MHPSASSWVQKLDPNEVLLPGDPRLVKDQLITGIPAQEAGTVRFVGPAGTHIITDKQWKEEQGIDSPTITWDSKTWWTLPLSELNKEVIEYLKTDYNFRVFEK